MFWLTGLKKKYTQIPVCQKAHPIPLSSFSLFFTSNYFSSVLFYFSKWIPVMDQILYASWVYRYERLCVLYLELLYVYARHFYFYLIFTSILCHLRKGAGCPNVWRCSWESEQHIQRDWRWRDREQRASQEGKQYMRRSGRKKECRIMTTSWYWY